MGKIVRDRTRTALSLLGVSIGIFTVTVVQMAVGALRRGIEESLDSFGRDVLIVDRSPMEPETDEDGNVRWWQYASRPDITLAEYRQLHKAFEGRASLAYVANLGDGAIAGVDGHWRIAVPQAIDSGRAFTSAEIAEGRAVALIGADFPAEKITRGRIRIEGHSAEVIGRMERAGMMQISMVDADRAIILPAAFARRLPLWDETGARILIQPRADDAYAPAVSENDIRQILRSSRRLSPEQRDDFSINRMSRLAEEFEDILRTVNRTGWIIGIFSLIVGAIGIANILFVSVRERTAEIGLKMAIGAPRRRILREFLIEAVAYSCAGGTIGLLAAALTGLVIPSDLIRIELTLSQALQSLLLAVIIGISAGLAPAIGASRMQPVRVLTSI